MSELSSRVRCLPTTQELFFKLSWRYHIGQNKHQAISLDNLFCEVLKDVIFVFSVWGKSPDPWQVMSMYRALVSPASVEMAIWLFLLCLPVQMLVVAPAPHSWGDPQLGPDLFSLYTLLALSLHHFVQGFVGLCS